eukprot:987629-Pelagomonas_calceolata.AAC.4
MHVDPAKLQAEGWHISPQAVKEVAEEQECTEAECYNTLIVSIVVCGECRAMCKPMEATSMVLKCAHPQCMDGSRIINSRKSQGHDIILCVNNGSSKYDDRKWQKRLLTQSDSYM